MSSGLRFVLAGLWRARTRTAVRIGVLALATGLLGAMVLFVGSALRDMRSSAVRSVPLDWQAPVTSPAQARSSAARLGRVSGVAVTAPVATAPLAGASHSGPAGESSSGGGGVLAVPPGYPNRFGTIRLLRGRLRPGAVVLDQQMAATLQARLGDRVFLTPRRGARPRPFPVSGVAIVGSPDVLFQPLDPRAGPAPAQPPANIAVLPFGTFARRYAPALRTLTPAGVGSSAVPGAQDGVQWQIHAQVDPAALHGGPQQALKDADAIRGRALREFTGRLGIVDNLADGLNSAASDSQYAIAMFILLAVPGAIVALGLAYLAALGTVERDRRELGLLRARGGTRAALLRAAAAESVVLGIAGGVLGTALARAAASSIAPGGAGSLAVTVAACVALAVAGALGARLAATGRVLSGSVAASRRGAARTGHPLWQRLGLDFVCLAASGLVWWLTARTGFAAVINPDANPTLSLSVYMLLGPALLWIGSALLLLRLRGRALGWALGRAGRGGGHGLARFLLASAGRRASALNRGLLVVGLLLAFGVELGLFTATWNRQSAVDAQLTLGADVVASAPAGGGTAGLERRVAAVPGVGATSAVEHDYAYVGPDLQDIFGVDPATIGRATTLRDSYFLGGSASALMRRLAARSDGILVSKETITDYGLGVGDLLRLRVLDRHTGRFAVVPFHVLGVVQEFPSAPRDSFMVTSRPYLLRADGAQAPNVVFAHAQNDPSVVAALVRAATRSAGVVVRDIRSQSRATASSITNVDLRGIARLEQRFVLALTLAAVALLTALALLERRRDLAVMRALGVPPREVLAFIWSELGVVVLAGTALAAALGTVLAEMLVAILRHAFDPPPDTLVVPWDFLGALAGGALLAVAFSTGAAYASIRRLPLGRLLRTG